MSVEQVTDVRSSPKDQIAHAAEVVGRSEHRRRVFSAVYLGKRKVKTVSEVVRLSGVRRIRVLQEAGMLADNKIVHKTKIRGELAYEKDAFYSQNKEKILRLAGNKDALNHYPTKSNPKGGLSISIDIPKRMVDVRQLSIDDIDSFSKVRKLKLNSGQEQPIAEGHFKEGLKRIMGEKGIFRDWGGEPNDLFSTRVVLGGRRVNAAFGLKGKGTKGILVPKKMGKNGDQLQRLISAPADVFLVQYWGQIDQSIIDQMRQLVVAKSWMEGRRIWFGVIDGQDTLRLVAAYKKSFS